MSYVSTHNRLRRVRGNASEHICVCGKPAREWAYSNESPEEEVDSKGRRYSRNLDDYTPMCRACHVEKDKPLITHCPQGHPYPGGDSSSGSCCVCKYARNREYKRKNPMTPEQKAWKLHLQNERRRKQREAKLLL